MPGQLGDTLILLIMDLRDYLALWLDLSPSILPFFYILAKAEPRYFWVSPTGPSRRTFFLKYIYTPIDKLILVIRL